MKSPDNRNSSFPLAIVIEGGVAVLAFVLAWIFGVALPGQFGKSASAIVQGTLLGVAATFPLLAAFWWLVHATWPAAQRLVQQVQELVRTLFPRASLVQLFAVATVAGLGEELLFRGVIQSLVARWTMPIIGLAVASLVFGVFHAVSPLYFLLASLAGLYFGWIVLASRDLLPAIVAHGLYDFIALAYLSRAVTDRNAALKALELPNERPDN
jgi:uncharacterized protein